ncbi:EamA family transporter [Paenibacillus validus]|uniref:EamA family transporter n=2 Tax=Paenibacillus validus TaxID=44253 RepID=UPI003D2C4310
MWFVLAAAAAACFGLRGILYQWTSKRPLDRNLMLFGVYLSGTWITLAAALALRAPWTPAVGLGALMGLFSFISNAAMYKGFAVGKMSLMAMFTGLPPVVVALLAFAVWGERLSVWQLLAFVVIMSGLLMVRYSNDLSLRNLQGAQWGVLTMLFFGLTDFFTKQATLLGAATFPTLVVMYATGGILFCFIWLRQRGQALQAADMVRQARNETAAASAGASGRGAADAQGNASTDAKDGGEPVNRTDGSAASSGSGPAAAKPWTWRRTLLWGMTVGITNASGMMLAMPAFKLGTTGLVSAVMAANVVLVMLYARFVLKEKFTRLELAGLMIGLTGIVLLKLLS